MTTYKIILNNAQFGTYFNYTGILQDCVKSYKQISKYHKLVVVDFNEKDIKILENICNLKLSVLVKKAKDYEENK